MVCYTNSTHVYSGGSNVMVRFFNLSLFSALPPKNSTLNTITVRDKMYNNSTNNSQMIVDRAVGLLDYMIFAVLEVV